MGIDRRTFLRALPLAGLATAGTLAVRSLFDCCQRAPAAGPPAPPRPTGRAPDPARDEGATSIVEGRDRAVEKSLDFDRQYPDDWVLAPARLPLVRRTAARLERARVVIGHGHYNLVGFDHFLGYARGYSAIGAPEADELELLEELFAADAKAYGFFGDKVIDRLTSAIPTSDTQKIAGSGHSLLRGDSLARYQQVRRDVGETIILTSGVRGLVKQFQLFLSKAVSTGGNLSQAARSLAPPGYSYHAVGDFDLGQVGMAEENFTDNFAHTREYEKLLELGYVSLRYAERNPFGVRHEPWHIKIV